jgi:hypothetical protein
MILMVLKLDFLRVYYIGNNTNNSAKIRVYCYNNK